MAADSIDALALAPGTRVDMYEVEQRLGEGGLGVVYLARAEGERFALKLSRQARADAPLVEAALAERRLRREVETLMAVEHPNIVKVRGHGRWPDSLGHLYLVEEYVDGGVALDAWVAKTAPSFRRLAQLFQTLADALSAMHKAHVFHRDLRPSNVLVDSGGQCRLIDFGLAVERESTALTERGTVVGTRERLSPDYCRWWLEGRWRTEERYPVGPTDELHAVGTLLYECLTGQPPFEEPSGGELELLEMIASKAPPTPTSWNPAVPSGLEAVVMRLLAKSARERFSSAGELAEALGRAAGEGDPSWDQLVRVAARRAGDIPRRSPGASAPTHSWSTSPSAEGEVLYPPAGHPAKSPLPAAPSQWEVPATVLELFDARLRRGGDPTWKTAVLERTGIDWGRARARYPHRAVERFIDLVLERKCPGVPKAESERALGREAVGVLQASPLAGPILSPLKALPPAEALTSLVGYLDDISLNGQRRLAGTGPASLVASFEDELCRPEILRGFFEGWMVALGLAGPQVTLSPQGLRSFELLMSWEG